MKNLDKEKLKISKIKDNDLIIIKTNNKSNIEINKYLINFVSTLIVEENKKISILNCNISPKVFYTSIINKQIKINKIKGLSVQQSKSNLEKIKSMIKSNIYINYTTEIYIDELIEKCQYLKNIKKVDIITISNIERIKDLNEENKQEFFKKLEKISIQLKITILLII